MAVEPEENPVKCVVWDLDNTLWRGVLLEGPVTLRPEIPTVIKTLDQRGILHSIASPNDHDVALAQVERFGLSEYFLFPQINWQTKSTSLATIADALNIGIDSLALIDDQAFEREEVRHVHLTV